MLSLFPLIPTGNGEQLAPILLFPRSQSTKLMRQLYVCVVIYKKYTEEAGELSFLINKFINLFKLPGV